MKKLVLVLCSALFLTAAPAQAKELLGAQLCGTDGCKTLRDSTLHEGPGGPFAGAGEIVQPAAPGGWLRGALLLGDHGKVFGKLPFYYVPAAGLVLQPAEGGQAPAWWPPQGRFGQIVRKLAAQLEPFPKPTLTSVTVNGEAVRDPASYLRLYSAGKPATTYPSENDSVQVVFESVQQTPWTAGNSMVVYPKSHLLVRDGQVVTIPRALAERAAAGESLDVGRSIPWTALAVALALLLAAAIAWRVRPRTAPQPVPQS